MGRIMRKGGLEKLILIGQIESERGRGKQRVAYLMGLSRWMLGRYSKKTILQGEGRCGGSRSFMS